MALLASLLREVWNFLSVYLKSFSYLFWIIFKCWNIQGRKRIKAPLWIESSVSPGNTISHWLFKGYVYIAGAAGASTLNPGYESCISIRIAGCKSPQDPFHPLEEGSQRYLLVLGLPVPGASKLSRQKLEPVVMHYGNWSFLLKFSPSLRLSLQLSLHLCYSRAHRNGKQGASLAINQNWEWWTSNKMKRNALHELGF